MTTQTTERHPLGLPGALGAVACWGTGNIIVREAVLAAIPLAMWRLAMGTVVYAAILAARRRRITWPQFCACMPAGLVSGAWIIVFYEALRSTTVANVTMIGALMPMVLFAVAARHFDEPVTLRLIGLAAAALGGTALVLYGSSSAPTWSARGDGLAVLALVLFAAYFAMAKRVRQTVGALEFQAVVWIGGLAVVAPAAAVTRDLFLPTPAELIWAAAVLAVPGTGHLLMNWAHSHVRLTVTSMATLGAAPLSMILAAIFLDEPIGALQTVGCAVVIAALVAVIHRDLQLTARYSTGIG